ncbi:MAG: hypothetical protein QME50_02990 [Candidatus Bathyarchaeota archaeon]|nr:hypothetical protein [Candidatus Bathyarchaeota archaeon]
MISFYTEIKDEKDMWDKKAKTVKDNIELRGKLKNPVKRLGKSRRTL